MRRGPFVLSMLVASIAGCSFPLIGRKSHPVASAVPAAIAEPDSPAAAPIVQVRGFWRSSVVSVVAWDLDEARVGLRTEVTRNGTLVGAHRFGDHYLYMSPFYAWWYGGFKYATVEPGMPLLPLRRTDPYSCFYGEHCSPMATVGVRMPDELLRAHRDSIVVTFHPATKEPWTFTVRRELIAAYLATVDSLVGEMRKVASSR